MGNCRWEEALDGHLVPFLNINGQEYCLGSRYDGHYMAQTWINFYVDQDIENIIFYGIGDGQIILQLMEIIRGKIIVIQPDDSLLHSVRQKGFWKKIQKCRKVILFSDNNWDEIEQVIRKTLNEDNLDCTKLAVHPGYSYIYGEELQKLSDICNKISGEISFMKQPIKRFIKAMIYNQIHNVFQMEKGVPVARLKKRWDKDIPVVLVSAGPSLEKNVDDLKRLEHRGLIFCVDAALTVLLRHGIVPDMIACTDATKKIDFYEDNNFKNIPLLVTTNAPEKLLINSGGVKLWGDDHTFIKMLTQKVGIEQTVVPFYSGVATALFATLLELGVKKIILIGQDLAYSEDGKSHVTGKEEGFVRNEDCRPEGYYGGKVWSRGDWMNFLRWFENAISVYSDRQVINATEGGVRIKGTEQRSLKDVINSLPNRCYDFNEIISNPMVAIQPAEYERLLAEYGKSFEDIKRIRELGYEKTFFEVDYEKVPIMRLVMDYMKSLDAATRKDRFEKALNYVENSLSEVKHQFDLER